jgi:adenylate cyclase class 2
MIEVEIKAHISEAEYHHMCNRLKALAFDFSTKVKEVDIYYNGPDKNYFECGEALRIRSSENLITNEKTSYITYKGKKLDTLSNTRLEHEVGIDNIDTMGQIFNILGFTELFTIEKLRDYYIQENIHVCVDYVKTLGYYLELEKIIPKESEKNSTLVELFLLLNKLGLNNDRLEGKSYANLLFETLSATK